MNSEIYVDKSELIAYTNSVLGTNQQYLCVSRPRRFGKSMAVDMKAWYEGYSFLKVKSVYNPKAVVEATLSGGFDSYWTKTETLH